MTPDQKVTILEYLPKASKIEAVTLMMEIANMEKSDYRPADGSRIDWHDIAYYLDYLREHVGLLETSKPGGRVEYRLKA